MLLLQVANSEAATEATLPYQTKTMTAHPTIQVLSLLPVKDTRLGPMEAHRNRDRRPPQCNSQGRSASALPGCHPRSSIALNKRHAQQGRSDRDVMKRLSGYNSDLRTYKSNPGS
mmetsp:Transcript_4670/g.6613  ORF Transcript_4670/g.6613 Transcript_4670/m.6613 type:complete len:115 (+) Transcript_4670:584-928(+)